MHAHDFKSIILSAAVAVLLTACAVQQQPGTTTPTEPESTQPTQPEVIAPPPIPRIDTMADVAGDKPAPLAPQGALERIDCKVGEEFLHARMALEARGGQITSFDYYSVWKPRTCAIDIARNSPGVKWRVTPDGAIRVHTPTGRFLIRTLPDAYVFEFEQVDRRHYCEMPGEINGSMTIRRKVNPPQCSVVGVMDTNDAMLDRLKQGR